ncbi:MAG TPA: type I phosphomannose isomerase catalytic subunit [Ktedonobacteraceae bacterium]|nr:type I phosphomannose isomerase catalytic subunit [Ktedonobacteraceae bacterium]
MPVNDLYLHPIRLEASLHETIWGGRRLEQNGWKCLPAHKAIGESWETELNTIAQNEPYAGMTLKALVEELGTDLLGEQCVAMVGKRFPLLAKFIDANDKLSVQVHPDDEYAARFEQGKLGKTEFWYVLDAEPGATVVHGFKARTSRDEVQQAIESVRLEELLHHETVAAGDVIFVPAGTVHAIGAGVLLYEVQEYSDITYRMYDYGRKDAAGKTRELHIEQALNVSRYEQSPSVKVQPAIMAGGTGYTERCLVACPYFVTRELIFQHDTPHGYMKDKTRGSCIILSSLGAQGAIRYGKNFEYGEVFSPGQTIVVPAGLGEFCIEGPGRLLLSYVPEAQDEAWRLWRDRNTES